ncbi:unnamed protein product, partial [Iphiclides podalirius]
MGFATEICIDMQRMCSSCKFKSACNNTRMRVCVSQAFQLKQWKSERLFWKWSEALGTFWSRGAAAAACPRAVVAIARKWTANYVYGRA